MPQLGVARGFIEINTARLQRQRQVVVNASRRMGQSIQRSFQGSASAVQSFNRQLENTRARIQRVQGELRALAVGGAALSGFGLAAADNLRTLQIRFRELEGSQERAAALMQQIADAAIKVGLPVRQTQQDFLGMVPAIRDAGGEIDTYLNLVSRLSLINPAEGTAGAIFAIREALTSGGTDLISLAERFNLPRKALRDLIAETGDFAVALDVTLEKQGATTEAAEAQARSLRGASARFRDAGRRALERAFTPALTGAADILDRFATTLDNLPDGLVQLGGGVTIAVTAIAGLTLAVGQLLSTYNNLRQAGFFTAFGGVGRQIGRAGVLAGAAAAGAVGGVQLVRAFGRGTGDERAAGFTLRDAGRILKQGIFLLVNALVEGARRLALATAEIGIALRTFPQQIQIISADLNVAFGRVLAALGGFVEGIPGFATQGRTLRTRGESLQLAGQAQAEQARAVVQQTRELVQRDINAFFDSAQQGIGRAFGFIETEAEETAETVERINPFDILRQQAARIGRAINAALEEQQADLIESLQERIQFEQELSKLLREGTPEQVEDRLQALQDEQAAIEKLLPGLQALAETNEDAAESAEQYRRRLTQIDEQMVDLGHALVVAAQRATETLDHEFLQKIGEIEAEREKALGEAFAEFEQDLADLDAEVAKRRGSLRDDQIEALDDFQERETKLVAAHMERLLEIERRSRRSILDAAARLDAAGVFAARERRQEELREAEKRRDDEREGSAERLDEQRERLGEEAAQIAEYYAERRGELETAHRQELNQIRSRFDAEIATERSAYNAERAQLQAHLQSKLAQERASQTSERLIRQAGQAAMLDDARRFAQGLTALGNQLGASVSAARQPQAAASRARSFGSNLLDLGRTTLGNLREAAQQQGRVVSVGGARTRSGASIPSGGAVNTITSAIGRVFRFNAAGASAFQTGGVPRFAGGSGFLFAENKERVLSERQNAAFERMVDFVTASGGSGRDLSRVSVDVSGAESVEALIADITRQVLGQVYEASIRGQEG